MYFKKIKLLFRKILKQLQINIHNIFLIIKNFYLLDKNTFIEIYENDKYIIENYLNDNSRKILIFNRNLPALGGGEKHMAYFCLYFEKYFPEYQIHLLVENSSTDNVFNKDYITIKEVNKTFNINLLKTRLLKYPLVNQQFLSALSSNYEIFINSSYKSSLYGDALYNYYNCMFPFEVNKNALREQFFLRKYDCFISNSKYTENWIKKYFSYESLVKCIYPPVLSLDDISKRNTKNKRNIIISVGRFFYGGHSKRQDIMIKLWTNHKEIFKNWELHLVGNVQKNKVDKKYFHEIMNLKKQSNNIYIHSNLDYNSLHKLYEEAKIYWHAAGYGVDIEANPSKVEHFGITTVEAMSYGVVPVVINKGGQKEIVDHSSNGFKWNNEEEWVVYTKNIMNSEKLRLELLNEAIEKSKLYTIEKFFENCEDLFSNVRK